MGENEEQKDVWFERFGLGYMPVNTNGWLALFAFIVAIWFSVFILSKAGAALGLPMAEEIGFILGFGPSFIVMMRFMKRRS